MDEKSAGSAGTFFSLLFFAQGGKERDPEEEELEGEADPGEGVVPGGVVEVLDAKGAFVEKEALIPEDPAADSGGDEEENEDDEEGEAFSPDGFLRRRVVSSRMALAFADRCCCPGGAGRPAVLLRRCRGPGRGAEADRLRAGRGRVPIWIRLCLLREAGRLVPFG